MTGVFTVDEITSTRSDSSRISSRSSLMSNTPAPALRAAMMRARRSGERRGHVSIAYSQGLLLYFMPQQIAQYRAEHPAVTFTVALQHLQRCLHWMTA